MKIKYIDSYELNIPENESEAHNLTPADFKEWLESTVLTIFDDFKFIVQFKQSLTHKTGYAIDWALKENVVMNENTPDEYRPSPFFLLNPIMLCQLCELTKIGTPLSSLGVCHLIEHNHVHTMVIVDPNRVIITTQDYSENFRFYNELQNTKHIFSEFSTAVLPVSKAESIRRARILGKT